MRDAEKAWMVYPNDNSKQQILTMTEQGRFRARRRRGTSPNDNEVMQPVSHRLA